MSDLTPFKRARSKKEVVLVSFAALLAVLLPELQYLPGITESPILFVFIAAYVFMYFAVVFACLNSDIFYVNQQGLLIGPLPCFPLRKVLWNEIEHASLNPKNPNVLQLRLNQNSFIGRFIKTVYIFFPLNKPELFKASIIKFSPVNNPLRVWSETH